MCPTMDQTYNPLVYGNSMLGPPGSKLGLNDFCFAFAAQLARANGVKAMEAAQDGFEHP